MILLKIARIICGDPTYADHWDDIAGYAMLGKGIKFVEDPCSKNVWWFKEGTTRPKTDYQVKEEPEEKESKNKCPLCDGGLAHNGGTASGQVYPGSKFVCFSCIKHIREEQNRNESYYGGH